MYREKCKFSNILIYSVVNTRLFMLKSNLEIVECNASKIGTIVQLHTKCSILVVGDYLYTSDNSNEEENYCIDLTKRAIIEKYENASFLNLDGNTTYKAFHLKHGGIDIYSLANKDKVKHIYGRFSLNNYLDERHIILNDRGYNTVFSYNISNGSVRWEEDLSSYGKIRKILGVAGDNLWVSCNNRKDGSDVFYNLICINVKDGVLLKHYSFGWDFDDYGVQLVERSQKIISLKNERFIEIDAVSGKLLRDLQVADLTKGDYEVRSFTVFEDNIYFTANDGTQIVANTVGVLDGNTLALLWKERVVPGHLNLEAPQVTKDKLYVLGNGVLHIFEKEK